MNFQVSVAALMHRPQNKSYQPLPEGSTTSAGNVQNATSQMAAPKPIRQQQAMSKYLEKDTSSLIFNNSLSLHEIFFKKISLVSYLVLYNSNYIIYKLFLLD